MAPLDDRVRHEFAALALGYYASGRLASRSGAGPLVSGQILHHAVEFILKATLARHTTMAEMKKFGHRLPDLFDSAGAKSTELRSSEYRATAAALHELWESRFPDRILGAGARTFQLADVDRLFCAGFRATGLTPAAFMQRLGPDALRAVLADNPEKDFLS